MNKKILLADDSITIQKVIELTFSDEDYDVITVGNGRLALEKLPEVRPDIVLCDIIMPEKDGYEVCEQIKTSPATAHIPVLLLTGAFEPFDQVRAARAGYDGSLAKPFEPETLIAKVKDLLARAPARAAAPPPPPVARPAARPPAAAAPPPPPAAPPAVLPFPRPAPPGTPPAGPTFTPEEFGGAEEPAFGEAAEASEGAFAPMTAEESATLMSPPAAPASPADEASTVMFRAGELEWNAPAPPAAPAPGVGPAGDRREPTTSPAAPELVFMPEPAGAGESPVEEPPVFEEVLEGDLDFVEAGIETPAEDSSSTVLFGPGVTLPPVAATEQGGTTEQLKAVRPDEGPASAFVEETGGPGEPEPAPPEGEPVSFEPEPVPLVPLEAESTPPEPAPAPARVAESFADVPTSDAHPAPAAPPPSEAAAVPVPVEMVEKIAQRVVAQVSEKAVREIAWEVIPDLAEALIKQEIERLKAELQKA